MEPEEPEQSKDAAKRDPARRGKKSSKQERKAEEKMKKMLEKYEEWKRKMEEEEERNRDPERLADPYAFKAKQYENTWNTVYWARHGRYEDNTSIPCKRFTFNPAPDGSSRKDATIQVFSVKISELQGGLRWPVSVFGMVALRDQLDHNRNIIFKRERDNCQTLTDKNQYLALTGPVRGVMFCDYVTFVALLYVRGTTESGDKELSRLVVFVRKHNNGTLNSHLIMRSYSSRLSTLDFELGHIVSSVEATISMKVISGPPDGFCGNFVASAGTLNREVMLHHSGSEERHLPGDDINLSRSVVSVEGHSNLMVYIRASDGSAALTAKKEFKPLEKGITTEKLDISLCQLEVVVAWSLFSYSGSLQEEQEPPPKWWNLLASWTKISLSDNVKAVRSGTLKTSLCGTFGGWRAMYLPTAIS
ncbi:hypothetical protein U9M48_032877 [Paspalum notatum var. saurae]|uniref:DUF6598 domain-containing protein n=1 Tax=Paspalum notatum var. saurae TaxID=547442 RepID=A0AAQ3U6R0_PASNO